MQREIHADRVEKNNIIEKGWAGYEPTSFKIPEVNRAHSHGKLTTNPWNDSNPYTGMRSSASG